MAELILYGAAWLVAGIVVGAAIYSVFRRVPYLRRLVQSKDKSKTTPASREIETMIGQVQNCRERLASGSDLARSRR